MCEKAKASDAEAGKSLGMGSLFQLLGMVYIGENREQMETPLGIC